MDQWWINGQPGTSISISDRGLMYGDGLFETIAVRGSRPRFIEFHLDRLLLGCQRLQIAPPTRAVLHRDLLAAAATVRHGVLKVVLTRGPGPRGYALPETSEPTLAWGVAETAAARSGAITVRWCETMASVNPATAGLKTLGRLDQVLARAEWSGQAVTEGLMRDANCRLIGGTASNVFLVRDGQLLTPAVTSAGIAGVMRRVVLEQARTHGLSAQEADLEPADIRSAAEVFITNALTGIRPVHRLDEQLWSTGPVTQRLGKLLAAAGVEECAAGY